MCAFACIGHSTPNRKPLTRERSASRGMRCGQRVSGDVWRRSSGEGIARATQLWAFRESEEEFSLHDTRHDRSWFSSSFSICLRGWRLLAHRAKKAWNTDLPGNVHRSTVHPNMKNCLRVYLVPEEAAPLLSLPCRSPLCVTHLRTTVTVSETLHSSAKNNSGKVRTCGCVVCGLRRGKISSAYPRAKLNEGRSNEAHSNLRYKRCLKWSQLRNGAVAGAAKIWLKTVRGSGLRLNLRQTDRQTHFLLWHGGTSREPRVPLEELTVKSLYRRWFLFQFDRSTK